MYGQIVSNSYFLVASRGMFINSKFIVYEMIVDLAFRGLPIILTGINILTPSGEKALVAKMVHFTY